MATVYAHTNDGYAGINNSDWRTARDAVGGTVSSSTTTLATVAVTTSLAATRGGGSSFQIYRSFFFFDVSQGRLGLYFSEYFASYVIVCNVFDNRLYN